MSKQLTLKWFHKLRGHNKATWKSLREHRQETRKTLKLIVAALHDLKQSIQELKDMANRIQPHPNPPYLKSDGTLNVSGKLELYAAGTSTPKVAYSDASGTSYGSQILLDSSGLPASGPIYWDTTALYKVEVYTRTDDTPTYALDYTVDNFGTQDGNDAISNITGAVTWTVDGVGAGSTEYATIAEALTATRSYVIMGGGGITINIDAGTYTDEVLDLSHPQGQYITLNGASTATTIILNSSITGSTITIDSGTRFGMISNLTIKDTYNTSVQSVLNIKEGAILHDLSQVTVDCNEQTGGVIGVGVFSGALFSFTSLVVDNVGASGMGVRVDTGGRAVGNAVTVTGNNGTNRGIYVTGAGSLYSASAGTTVNGTSGGKLLAGIHANQMGAIDTGSAFEATECTTGVTADEGGIIVIPDTTPTFTSCTASYSQSVDVRPSSVDGNDVATAANNDAGSLIIQL